MATDFVHLHVHSQYSLLDGSLKIKPENDKPVEARGDLANRVKRMEMSAVALTDHANMFGAIGFYKACKDVGIAAILGCEVNVVRDTGAHGRAAQSAPVDHLVMLAASEEGYHNIVRVVSLGHIQPASDVAPSVSMDTIRANSRGVVMLTGCLGGVLAQSVLHNGPDAAMDTLAKLKDIAEPGHLFVELQDHGLAEQPVVNGIVSEAAARMGLPVVATNDVHYPDRDDADAHLLLSCIATGQGYEDAKSMHHGSREMYLKSPDEMAQVFRHQGEALSNTMLVKEMCTGWKLKLGQPMLPKFEVPSGSDTTTYFIKVAMDGLKRRLEEYKAAGKQVDEELYRKRLEREISVIVEMKFPGYFLIVWDFIRFAKDHGIPVGPGRGSGAGSLVAYAMRITELDPMPYDLLFERFLNPERISMPDFDVDFCMDRRDEVIRYVAQKYGKNSVGQIAAFHELKARSVLKDVGRAMGVPPSETQRLANLVPTIGPGKTATIPQAIEMEPKLKAIVDEGGQLAEVVRQAQKIEGLTRHVGMHAAGVVIADGPLWDHVPAFKHGDTLVTQYYMADVEQAGLVKFDFLGLRTLTIIDIAVRLVNKRPDRTEPLNINRIPMDDDLTFALLQSGETTGVFQLESSGMQQLFKRLRPDCFEDIVAAVALYRPGPLETGMVDQFVRCKHGREAIQSMHPLIDDTLRATYGVIVYQEQVMQIAQKLAGYTLGGADLLRRAMGKKKKEEMDKQLDTFVTGAVKNGVDAQRAREIFDLVAKFAGYGFNRSHSAGYALVTYQTAYLKAHYPAEFMCAIMTADREKTDKVVRSIGEGRAMGLEILAPDINDSDTDFKVVYASPQGGWKAPRGSRVTDPLHPKVRFGLGAVRGVGDAALETVFEARSKGPFRDLFDFASRVDARKINRGVMEALVQCGAFDSTCATTGVTRAQLFAAIDMALERGRSASKDRERGQTSLFGLFDSAAPERTSTAAEYPQVPSWDLRETFVREKQALGFYISGHPLDRYGTDLGRFDLASVESLAERQPWEQVRVAGVVEGYHEKIFKGSSGKAAFFELEDKTGKVTVRMRDNQIDRDAPVITSGDPVVVSGKLKFAERDEESEESEGPRMPTLLLDRVELLSELVATQTRAIHIRLDAKETTPEAVTGLRDVLRTSPGPCNVVVVFEMPGGAEVQLGLPPELRVTVADGLFAALEKHFGRRVAELR